MPALNAMSAILSEQRLAAMQAAGLWRGDVVIDWLDRWAAAKPDAVAFVGHCAATDAQSSVTFGQLAARSRAYAHELRLLGIRAGDVVSMQLPNCWQFVAIHLACVRIGAVTNPLVTILRERELEFMLGLAEARVMITCGEFRGFDHLRQALNLRAKVSTLRHVLLVEEHDIVLQGERPVPPGDLSAPATPLMPNDVVEILYTSGTTGEPKGVMHTSNTLFSTLPAYADGFGLTGDSVVLMGSPLSHQTGFIYGMMLPIMLGCRSVLMDVWDGGVAARLIAQHGVTYSMGSTPFLADLAAVARSSPASFASLDVFHAAGSPIPRQLVRDARRDTGAHIMSGWGMTENGAVTRTLPTDSEEKVFETDGRALDGMEIRVVDAAGAPVPAGTEGRLQVRGCSNFVGYLKRPQLYDTDKEGWFETGDVARMDEEGFLRITGRNKDILIRGGENIPVVEIEGLLFTHPAIREVAIVGKRHPRLGEKACAFIVADAGARLDVAAVAEFLLSKKVSKSYLPEYVVVVDAMPKTPSGKIQKFLLRSMAEELPEG